ncbi:Protein component of ribonuclease P (RNase P) [Bacillus subtilis QB928]|nr:Protein component of ribonuclease P (RNase P) [Bacillus subtilis QB928]
MPASIGVSHLKKRNRLKKNEDFQKVFKHGTSVANRQFVLYTLDQPENDELRVGLSVSKKIGNAVMRNRIKRLIRQAFLEEKERLKEKDYIIIARKPASQLTYEETKKSLQHLFRKSSLYKKSSSK